MVLLLDSNKVRIRIKLAYDGTDFYGWQRQPNVEPTIQGLLEKNLSQIFNQNIAVVGSGRTDRGVHALAQWAHFDLPADSDYSQLQYKLQRMTPESVSIKLAEVAPAEFHAQISAESKCYFYRLQVADTPNPFLERYSWQRKKPIDFNKLNDLSAVILGSHDFTSFQSQGTPVSTPVREIFVSRWVKKSQGIYDFQIQGSGFLKQMVRNLVGTMVKTHDQGGSAQQMADILEKRDRALASAPAPAQGLYLSSVQYPKNLDNKCRKL